MSCGSDSRWEDTRDRAGESRAVEVHWIEGSARLVGLDDDLRRRYPVHLSLVAKMAPLRIAYDPQCVAPFRSTIQVVDRTQCARSSPSRWLLRIARPRTQNFQDGRPSVPGERESQ
jgi:hypothetical protein